MEILTLALLLFTAVLASGMISRMLPLSIPLPLVQIALGFLISGVFQHGVTLNPELFFLLFLPPLLFLDGWRIPKQGLLRDKFGILNLAFGLVFFTVIGLGFLIHWMIPVMPLPVAFALAAIVSPTDPVAVSAITRRVPLPRRLVLVLEGESLFNDASGLVAFRFAVAAAVTGTFSLSSATLSFLWVALGGLAVGTLLTGLLVAVRARFVRRYGEEPGAEILLSVLTPFAAYFLAEHVHASGILAAVAAGVVMSYADLSGGLSAVTRVQRKAFWDTVQFALNGMMFVLLGEQLPRLLQGAVQVVESTGHHNPAWLLVYAVVICAALALLRFVWVWLSLKITSYLGAKRGQLPVNVNPRLMAVMSLAGVRGAVTLAGVLTLPLVTASGAPLPARDLAIFLAASVIILSLIAASIGLPRLLNGMTPVVETRSHRQQLLIARVASRAARRSVSQALASVTVKASSAVPATAATATDGTDAAAVAGTATAAVATAAAAVANGTEMAKAAAENEAARLFEQVAHHVLESMDITQKGADLHTQALTLEKRRAIERQLRLKALQASRRAVYRLARTHRVSDELAREHVRLLDLQEAALME